MATPLSINDEYLKLLNQSIYGLLTRYLGVPKDLVYPPLAEDEPIGVAHLSSDIFLQLEKIQLWASDRAAYLNSLATLDKTIKERALWDLPPCPLFLVELYQLLQQVNGLAPGDIGRSYVPALLVGVASMLGNLLQSSMYLIALHSRATNQTKHPMPTDAEIWQSIKDVVTQISMP
ncbi:hypothetical protein HEMROJRC1_09940 [Rodentibacter sp. JRC1]|nr:hypothetical protein [Rodentibacter sp. JRC1]GJI55882.1 hypothetical protein HEMROJRC1_09940 [Rodentibacter sp. JRC1]